MTRSTSALFYKTLFLFFSYSHGRNVNIDDGLPLFVYPTKFNDSQLDAFVAGKFPDNFKFGVSTSAYQTEGAWNIGGKTDSIWDTFAHTPEQMEKGTGDEATESYYYFQDADIEMLKQIGVDHYRFSISWSRVLPNGVINDSNKDINPIGVAFYNNLIDSLVQAGIEPMVTLLHWDFPQVLQDQGGQTSEKLSDWFEQYADFCFKTFGDRVKLWLTFNEPFTTSLCYETADCAPGFLSKGVLTYQNAHQQLLAHARAYHLYNDKYKPSQGGKLGIVGNAGWHQPYNNSDLNLYASDRLLQFQLGWVLSPLLGNGDYPDVMKDTIAELSEYQGFPQSRLPEFTDEQKENLLGSLDFLGLNYYGGDIVNYIYQIYTPDPSMENDQSVEQNFPEDWIQTMLFFNRGYPAGLRKLLRWIKEKYGQKYDYEIFITENGYAAPESDAESPCLQDTFDIDRMKFLVAHLNQLYLSITEDNVNVTRYTSWALMDTYNFGNGYSIKFGLYCVDFDSETKQRYPRFSSYLYNEIIRNRGFDNSYLMEQMKDMGILELLEQTNNDDYHF
ncbi:myrosinase 1-like [Convolutriloba macropyga]|uniref:myrosinase 1-like n=1 Tax=Convolutriloba macropyga TaxID=536237 RepID=UPI003F51EC06